MQAWSQKLRRTQLGAPPEERGICGQNCSRRARAHQTTGKQIGLAVAQEPDLFWALDHRPCLWLHAGGETPVVRISGRTEGRLRRASVSSGNGLINDDVSRILYS
jgi:hypothetical protein